METQLKALVIEDDEQILELVSQVIADCLPNCSVDKAKTVDKAGKFLDKNKYDLVIAGLDLRDYGEESGLTLLIKAGIKKKKPKRILMSGDIDQVKYNPQPGYVRKMASMDGVDDIWDGPQDMEKMKELIRRVMGI